ncbi:MAG: DUF4445 domain-containing protein [Fibrobacteres bacterium]|nr:DUF4445 domain-containing protein [Fibrobacterota bacterium]
MPIVTFQPIGKSVSASAGTLLIDCAKTAGVSIDAPCGGKGACGKCMVRVKQGNVDSQSLGTLSKEMVADGYVLACKAVLLDEDVTIETPERTGWDGGKFAESLDEECLIRRELMPSIWEFDPLAIKWMIQVPPAELEDGLSDFDRFSRAIQKEWGPFEVVCSINVLRGLAETLRIDNGRVTVSLVYGDKRLNVLRVEPSDSTLRNFGIAVDIGTTTIAVQLVSLEMGKIVATQSDYNGQITCGLDVISRINYARLPERREELRALVLKTINGLIKKTTSAKGVSPLEICNAVISGNTTMIHLLLGLNPEYIRLDPYTPTILKSLYLTAAEVGVDINPDSWICLSPCVGSYVGGDITAGILCTDLATDSEEVNLFIDIGTNGEIVLGNRDFLMSCACSAGPAFEGGGIDCGMRAALGAIERVEVDPITGLSKCWTVGGTTPQGICGSGIIALVADLFMTGWIDSAGKLNRSKPSPAIEISGRNAYYVLVPAEKSGTGKALRITETDIENIIRTKAAIYSACALMLKQVDMTFNDIACIYIAGGFGRFLDLDKATILGLIPDLPREKFKYIGNASLMGSYMTLVSRNYYQKQIELANRMAYIDLSSDPTYMDQYMAALFLPHTEASLFPTVKPRK